MLDRIIKYSLNSRLVIVSIAVLILTAGTIITMQMEIDVFPDLTAPTVVVKRSHQHPAGQIFFCNGFIHCMGRI
ncbi:hypothetical protein ES708_29320 [subsurface metagenome]